MNKRANGSKRGYNKSSKRCSEAQEQAAANDGQLRERAQELAALQATYAGQQAQVERLSADVRRWRRRIPDMQAELDEKDMEVRTLNGRLHSNQLQLRRARRPIADSGRLTSAQQQARLARLQAQVTVAEAAGGASPGKSAASGSTADARKTRGV